MEIETTFNMSMLTETAEEGMDMIELIKSVLRNIGVSFDVADIEQEEA